MRGQPVRGAPTPSLPPLGDGTVRERAPDSLLSRLPVHSARRGWHKSRNPQAIPGGSVCGPHNTSSLFLRLFFWAAFCLPAGLVLRSLYRAHTPTTPARLRHLRRRYRRRLHHRLAQAPVPPLRRSSSLGRPAGIAWPADSECDSSACGLVWGEDVYAPFLTGRPAMRHPGGLPTEDAASGSTTGGTPKASETGGRLLIHLPWSRPFSGSPFFDGWDGLPPNSPTLSPASDGNLAADRGRATGSASDSSRSTNATDCTTPSTHSSTAATRFSFGGQTTGETGPRWEASDEC